MREWNLRAENRPTFESLCELRTSDGRKAINARHKEILRYVGSWRPRAGCFERTARMRKKLTGTDRKTFAYNLEYLEAIGALVRGKDGAFRLGRGQGPVMSQAAWRSAVKKVASYRYRTTTYGASSFFKNGVNHPNRGGNSPHPDGVIHPTLPALLNQEVTEAVTITPPQKPPQARKTQDVVSGTRDASRPAADGRLRDHLILDGCHHRSEENNMTFPNPSNGNINDDFNGNFNITCAGAEDVPRKPKDGNVGNSRGLSAKVTKDEVLEGNSPRKTQRERERGALSLIHKGHIANPLGGPDNKPRQITKRARDIAPTGAVTVPQLYKHLCGMYERAFGPGLIESMLPTDRHAIQSMFDNLRQAFAEECNGYNASYRDLAEYFEWFLKPERLDRIMGISKLKLGYIPWQQMCGGVWLRRYYEAVVLRRRGDAIVVSSSGRERIGEIRRMTTEAFEDFAKNEDDDEGFVMTMANVGFALAGAWLHDEKHMNASEAKHRIIEAMVKYLRMCRVKSSGIEVLKFCESATVRNAEIGKYTSIWSDPVNDCKGFVDIAIEKAGLKNGGTEEEDQVR